AYRRGRRQSRVVLRYRSHVLRCRTHPGVALGMRTDHPAHQRPDDGNGPWRQLARFQMHVYLATLIGKGFDQIGFAGDELPIHLTHPGFIDRYLMKITRPKIESDVNYVHADVSSF